MKSQDRNQIAQVIQSWYRQHHRNLPWRRSRNPYHIWISEIMLQQTQVETVIPYYQRFIKQFPTISSLAGASLEEVLKAWENMGYYSRARHLHETARKIVGEMGGKIPQSKNRLLSLPGIGPYTAAAILSFAYHQPVAAVDGNVKRILARLFLIKEPLEKHQTRQKIEELAQDLTARADSADINQGLMDFGTAVCRPRNPFCLSCPLMTLCQAFKNKLQDELPVRTRKAARPHKDFTAGFLQDVKGRLLIARRPNRGLLGGLWKLPGGERKGRVGLKISLASALESELGLTIHVGQPLASIKHAYTHFRITLHAFSCFYPQADLKPASGDNWVWCRVQDLDRYPFSKGDRKIIEAVLERNPRGPKVSLGLSRR